MELDLKVFDFSNLIKDEKLVKLSLLEDSIKNVFTKKGICELYNLAFFFINILDNSSFDPFNSWSELSNLIFWFISLFVIS